MPHLLITLGVAIFLAFITLAILIPLRPNTFLITERFVCPKGTKMKVQTTTSTYHRDGERGLVITCQGKGQTRYVNGRAFLVIWLISFLISLPIAYFTNLFIF